MTVCQTPCENCNRQGLPLLFTRYASAYSNASDALLQSLAPQGALQAQPGKISLKGSRYNVRLLRRGYLYVLIQRGGNPKWMGYQAHPHGYLRQFDPDYQSKPDSEAPVACDTQVRGAGACMVMIPDVKSVQSLHYLFHPHPIPLKRLLDLQKNPKSMQSFDVAAWANGTTKQADSCSPDTLSKTVVEWAALKNTPLQQVINEQLFGLMGFTAEERGWGDIGRVRQVKKTREEQYGYVRRTVEYTVDEPYIDPRESYAQAHGDRLQNIEKRLIKDKGAILVCEDPIGITQELAHAYLPAAKPYTDWLALEDKQGVSNDWKVETSMRITQLHKAIRAGVVESAEGKKIFIDDLKERNSGWAGTLFPADYEEQMSRMNEARRKAAQTSKDPQVIAQHKAEADAAEAHMLTLYDEPSRTLFDTLHLPQWTLYQTRLAVCGNDHVSWLDDKRLQNFALMHYDRRWADQARQGDATRLNAQDLGIAYTQSVGGMLGCIDASEPGKKWAASHDLLEDSDKNLALTAAALFDRDRRRELIAAIQKIPGPLPTPGAYPNKQTDPNGQQKASFQASLDATVNALGLLKTYLGSLEAAFLALGAETKVTGASSGFMHNVICFFGLRGLQTLHSGQGSGLLAKAGQAQALALISGWGEAALPYLREQQAALATASPTAEISAVQIQEQFNHAVKSNAATGAAKTRVAIGLGIFEVISLAFCLNKFNQQADDRSFVELGGQLLTTVGTVYSVRAAWMQNIIDPALEAFTAAQRVATAGNYAQTLRGLQVKGWVLLSSGAFIGVLLDGNDAMKASNEGERRLAVAYYVRAGAGFAGILLGAGALYLTSPGWVLWLAYLNWAVLALTVAASIAILILVPPALDTWLTSCPFRRADSKKKHTKMQETLDGFGTVLNEVAA